MSPLSLSGQVLDAAGRPLPGATVMITGGAGDFSELAALTDGQGTFALDGLGAPGTYQVLVVHGGTQHTATLQAGVPGTVRVG
jgi:hypothetical protein